jgi:integrase
MPARDPFSSEDEQRLLALLPALRFRDQALILVGLDTGFRARELGAMEIRHALDEHGEVRHRLTLERRHLKHGRGAYRAKIRSRSVPLSVRARAALERYLADRRERSQDMGASEAREGLGPNEPLFLARGRRNSEPDGLSIWQINRIVKDTAARAGCSPDAHFGSHSLRKSFARRVYERSGHDINLTRVALGHSSIQSTVRYLSVSSSTVDAVLLSMADTAA